MMDISNSVDVKTLNQKTFDSSVENIKNDDRLKEVCDDFEAYFIQQMMDVSLKNSTLAGEEAGSDIIKGMYTETMSREVAGGMGISNILYEYLSKK